MLTCINPRSGYSLPDGSRHFGRPPRGHTGQRFPIRCGICDMCLLWRSAEMAARAVHECKMHPDGFAHFLTLTYDEDHLPPGAVLVERHLQLFWKRLRFRLAPMGHRVRYLSRGEYGGLGRPHYHALAFGFPLDDLKHYSGVRDSGNAVYSSALLDDVWGLGAVKVGSVTPASAQYVAGYLDKLEPHSDLAHMGKSYAEAVLDPVTGEIVPRPLPFNRYSTRPGIGAGFAAEFHTDLWPSDFMVIEGRIRAVPRYYSKLLERVDPDAFAAVKARREALALSPASRRKSRPYHVRARAEKVRAAFKAGKPGQGIV